MQVELRTNPGATWMYVVDDDGKLAPATLLVAKTRGGVYTVPIVDSAGRMISSIDPPSLSHVAIDFSSGSAQTIVPAPGAGKRIRITSIVLTSLANVEVAVKSGSTTIMTLQFSAVELSPRIPLNLGTDEALVLDAVSADRITGGVSYYVEDVA